MTKLGTKKKPLVLRVQNADRAEDVAARCTELNVQFILGIETDKPEDLTDLDRYLRKSKPTSFWTFRSKRADSGTSTP